MKKITKYDKFWIRYIFVIAECAVTLNDTDGTITSPGFPKNYYNNIDCTWLIRVPVDEQIKIHFLSFDVGFFSYSTATQGYGW